MPVYDIICVGVGVCVRVGDADIRCRVDTFEYYDTISREF